MFCDQTQLVLTAGSGGKGCIAFLREKFIAKGGPNGGNGGKGGDMILKVNTALNSLIDLHTYKKFTADAGMMGLGQNKYGKNGEDMVLEVPLGTIVREIIRNTDEEIIEKKVIADLSTPGKSLLICKGGRGGYGNAHFVSSVRQAPKFAELGEDGEQIEVELELKLVADIGIIGIPSAGKSTLISVISNAKPKIADYHFTTLKPNLGVVKIAEGESFVVADIPGLIENAHEGKGLGIKFLKHIQRCRLLVHLIDPIQPDLSTLEKKPDAIWQSVINNFVMINAELEAFSPELATKQQLVVINKSDQIDEELAKDLIEHLKKETKKDKRFIFFDKSISAATTANIQELKYFLSGELNKLPKEVLLDPKSPEAMEDPDAPVIYRPHLDNPKYFSIEKVAEETFKISGQRIEQIVNMTDVNNPEAMMRVDDVLFKMGIAKELKKQGAQDGCTLIIGKHELEFTRD
ncbi:MAG: GTPase ObgE [Candidatus Gracilibacteria bacterium]|nr:GTPase ObgE [Candidatus Gracilibacteria bacterium]